MAANEITRQLLRDVATVADVASAIRRRSQTIRQCMDLQRSRGSSGGTGGESDPVTELETPEDKRLSSY
jgi:hypothetical protein